MRHGLNRIDKDGFDLTHHAQCTGQRTAICSYDGGFTCSVYLGQQHSVCVADDLDEILKTIPRAGKAVRLKCQHQAPAREGATRSCKCGGHLDRVMAIVFNHCEAPVVRRSRRSRFDGHIAITLKAATDTLELCQRFLHGSIGHIEFNSHGNSRQGVEHIVLTRQVKYNVQVGQRDAVAPACGKVHLPTHGAHMDSAHLCLVVKTVTGDGA